MRDGSNESTMLNFGKTWDEYKNGFGNPTNSQYWMGTLLIYTQSHVLAFSLKFSMLGNDRISSLTTAKDYEMLVTGIDSNNVPFVTKYGTFKVLPEDKNYEMTLGPLRLGCKFVWLL